jgi:DNA polymerase
MIVGEAPNKEEDAYGMPFIGNVGFVLNSILTDSGIYRDDVYITHAVKCRSNKRITHNDVDMCRFNLKTQQIILNPTVIITLGSIALYAITRQRSISKLRGKFIILPNGIHVMPTLHPTNLIRSSNYELYDKVVKDFIKAKSLF